MEAGVGDGATGLGARARRFGLWVALGVVLLIRLPFLHQAVQGDDPKYLAMAAHALIDPLHPAHTTYVFQGDEVDMRGLSHPPLNAWVLAGLLAVFGDVKEPLFHAAYLVFSLAAVWAMWILARRFSPQPLWATLLFIAVPAFVVNGNSLESDLPFLALWMASMALFVMSGTGGLSLRSRILACGSAAFAMALAAMAAYQAIFLIPILAVYCWLFRRRDYAAWLILLTPALTIGAWQVFERLSTGAMPAAVLTGYFSTYGFQALEAKLANALMLFIHSWFIVFPALVPAAFALAWRRRREPETLFLLAWIGIFFAGALVVFFAGSARYLLPMAAPVALLASRLRPRWLALGVAAQLALGLGLAAVNYQHWSGYRKFAESLRGPASGHRVWSDGEWGIHYYQNLEGALPLTRTTHLRGGDIVVVSDLSHAVDLHAQLTAVAQRVIRPALPLRLYGLETHSGYSTVSKGFWPFGLSAGVIDRVRALEVVERRPTLQYLLVNAPEAVSQIVSGLYDLEDNRYRWMARTAVVTLKSPAAPAPLEVSFTIPGSASARRVTVRMDGHEIATQTYPGPGTYTLSVPARPTGAYATVEIEVDRTFTAPPDRRDLGIVITAVGFPAR